MQRPLGKLEASRSAQFDIGILTAELSTKQTLAAAAAEAVFVSSLPFSPGGIPLITLGAPLNLGWPSQHFRQKVPPPPMREKEHLGVVTAWMDGCVLYAYSSC